MGIVSYIKKYFLETNNKGELYLYTLKQCKKILKEIMTSPKKGKLSELLKSPLYKDPKSIEKYKNTYLIAESEEEFYYVLEGEARNIIQSFFKSKKELSVYVNYKIVFQKK